MSEEHPTPRAIDVVLQYRIVEALRDAAIAKIGADMHEARLCDEHHRIDVLKVAGNALRMLDIDAVLGDLVANMAPDEAEAFEAAAKTASFNAQKLDSGTYLHPITRRAQSVWKAAVRWHQLRQMSIHSLARRADDQQQGENQ